MTVTYDPTHPRYYDEADLRAEIGRVFDLCHGCRLCYSLCPAFPSMFEAIDSHDGSVPAMTTPEQDRVVDECYQCKLCYLKCPYTPPHEWQLDFPRLMLRAVAVRHRGRRPPLADEVLGRTDLMGQINSRLAPLVNAATAKRGSPVRKVMERTLGLASQRLLPPYARERFSTWFRKRARPALDAQASVAVFPTCFVEYNAPAIGKDLVKVFEHNRVACELPDGIGCCGAPWLHAGHFDRFIAQAKKNLPLLAQAIRRGRDIVVAQPTCGYVLRYDYLDYVGGPDAEALAVHTFDASEYLMRLHRDPAAELRTDFAGEVPESVAYHAPCHMQAQNIGFKSRDLLKLTGTKIELINQCSGIDGTWGLKAANYDEARRVAEPLVAAVRASDASLIVGDCTLADGAIEEGTGRKPLHTLQVMARAYGIPEEP